MTLATRSLPVPESPRRKTVEAPLLANIAAGIGELEPVRSLINGAIDDNANGKGEHPKNYVEAAVASALAGQSVETPQTKPYGCSVKYGKKADAKSASAS